MTATGSEDARGRAWRLLRDYGVLLVLAAFFVARLPLLDDFMTHVDDIGVICQLSSSAERGLLAQLERARSWTYAPAQFVPQALLLRLAVDPEALLFWGRLPSLVAWFVGLVAAHRLFRATYPERPWVADLLVAIQGVSWRGLLESSQAYNYATTPFVAAASVAFFLREGQRLQDPPGGPVVAWGTEWRSTLASGLLLGSLVWITYQALFLGAAGFVGLGVLVAASRRREAILRLFALALTWAVPAVLVFFWHLKDVSQHRIAPWIPRSTPAGLLDVPWFLVRSWFEVVQNVVTFLPWGAGSAALAALVLVGTASAARRSTANLGEPSRAQLDRAVLAILLGTAVVFSAGPLLALFPLSCTRHTYVLQVPILLALGLGLNRAGVSRRLAVAFTVAVLVVGGATAITLFSRTGRKIDLAAVEGVAAADSQVGVMSFEVSATYDHMLLLRAHPEWAGRFFVVKNADVALVPGPPPSLLVISHRRPLSAVELKAFRECGYGAPETVQEVAPTGFTELSGDLNGGNGAFVVLLRRRP